MRIGVTEYESLTCCEDCENASDDGFICFGTTFMPSRATFPKEYCSWGKPRQRKEEEENENL